MAWSGFRIFGKPERTLIDEPDDKLRVEVINHLGDEAMKVFRI